MGDGQENKIIYPLIAGMCALLLIGGPIAAALIVRSAKHSGKTSLHPTVAVRESAPGLTISKTPRNEHPPAHSSETAKQAKTTDPDEARVKELIRKLQEPKKQNDSQPPEEKPAEPKPVPPPPDPAEEKKADRSGALSPTPLSPEEKMLEIIRAFIVRRLAHPDGFNVVDHTKPQRVKAANRKPAQVMRVVFRAQDGSDRAGAYDFLFVVQNDEVAEHAPTAAYVAAERTRQQAMLQVALLNEAMLQQQLQAEAGAASGRFGYAGGGGCILTGG